MIRRFGSVLPDAFDLAGQDVVSLGTFWTKLGLGFSLRVQPVRRRGDLQHPANRLDPVRTAAFVDGAAPCRNATPWEIVHIAAPCRYVPVTFTVYEAEAHQMLEQLDAKFRSWRDGSLAPAIEFHKRRASEPESEEDDENQTTARNGAAAFQVGRL